MRERKSLSRSVSGRNPCSADTARQQRTAGLDAMSNDVLNDDGCGHGAEDDPETDGSGANGPSQGRQCGGGIDIFKTGIGHEIEDALGHEGGDGPAQRPEQNADKIHEITVAGMLQRGDGHEPDEEGRKGIAEIQDDGLKDVTPKHHQGGELADEPQNGGDDEIGGDILNLGNHVPPGRLRGRITVKDEQVVELLIDLRRVDAKTGEDGIL